MQDKAIKLWLNLKKGELNDPLQLMRDVSGMGKSGNGDYEIKVENEDNLQEILALIQQVIEKKK